jgi:hypothetical protein
MIVASRRGRKQRTRRRRSERKRKGRTRKGAGAAINVVRGVVSYFNSTPQGGEEPRSTARG